MRCGLAVREGEGQSWETVIAGVACLPRLFVFDMTADENGNLYVLSRDGGIWRTRDLTTWTRLLSSPVGLLSIGYWAEWRTPP
ncbi:hypothetical protein GC175_32720 [bacterium]|nr:hypothetical protein [bacterium]